MSRLADLVADLFAGDAPWFSDNPFQHIGKYNVTRTAFQDSSSAWPIRQNEVKLVSDDHLMKKLKTSFARHPGSTPEELPANVAFQLEQAEQQVEQNEAEQAQEEQTDTGSGKVAQLERKKSKDMFEDSLATLRDKNKEEADKEFEGMVEKHKEKDGYAMHVKGKTVSDGENDNIVVLKDLEGALQGVGEGFVFRV